MIKIIITGSNGLLGQSLLKLLLNEKEKYKVVGFSKGVNRSGRDDFDYVDIDLTNENLLKQNITEINPDFIINTAAMTQVDDCEDEKKKCDLINVNVVEWLTNFAQNLKIHIIHLSTDFIFDGQKGFYKETDIPNPVSYYGLSKLKAEQILQNSNIDFTIIRTILVFGKVYNMSRSNIVLWVKSMLEQNKEITIVNDQFRMPTYVDDLSLACKIIVDKKARGIYHISSNTLLSVFEIANQIAEVFNLNKDLIKPITSNKLNQKALRPPKTGFDLTKSYKELNFKTNSFKEDLYRFKDNLI